MCYSASASFTTFFISLFFILLLWNRNNTYDRWNALFILSFAMIQLWEGFIWMYGMDNEYISNIVVPLILITLYTQPFVQTYMAYSHTNSSLLYLLSIFYFLLLFYILYRSFHERMYVSTGPHNHLIWHSCDSPSFIGSFGLLYLIGMFIGLVYGFPNTLPLFVYGCITFIYSTKYWKTLEFSSYWCFIAVGYSILAYFI